MDEIRIGKLPSGLELWLNCTEAFTIPSRSSVAEIQQTLAEVKAWAKTNVPAHPEAVTLWLDMFDDQYQEREAREEWTKGSFAGVFAQVNAMQGKKKPN